MTVNVPNSRAGEQFEYQGNGKWEKVREPFATVKEVEALKEEIAQLREQVRLIRMILDGNGIEY